VGLAKLVAVMAKAIAEVIIVFILCVCLCCDLKKQK
jgi:hypothetical protein